MAGRGRPAVRQEIVDRMKRLFVLVDPLTLRPEYTLDKIVELVNREFGVSIARPTLSRYAMMGEWEKEREAEVARMRKLSETVDLAAARRTLANVDEGPRVDMLTYSKEHVELLAKLTKMGANALGLYLQRHLLAWKALEEHFSGVKVLKDGQLRQKQRALLKPEVLIKVVALGSAFINDRMTTVFINQFNQQINKTNFFAWQGVSEEDLPALPELEVDNETERVISEADAALDEPPID